MIRNFNDATSDVLPADGGLVQTAQHVVPAFGLATGAQSESSTKFLFIDSRVPDFDAIVRAAEPGVQVVLLDPAKDGVHQIAEALASQNNVAAISIVSHGDEGVLLLGSGPLHTGNLSQYAADLQTIGAALSEQGDILLYGCDVGAGEQGATFMTALANATGADVAASNNATGGVGRGDWQLEISTGTVESAPMLRQTDLSGYAFSLHTASVSNVAALKTALATASTDGQDDTITLLNNLTFSSASDAVTINVTDGKTLSIVGGGFTLSGNNLARVLNIAGGSVAISNITVSNGFVTGNGGNVGAGTTGGAGGDALGAGIWNAGTLTITNSTVTSNKAAGGGGGGGQAGGVSAGGGGGGGGFVPTSGGTGGTSIGYSPGAPSSGTGGNGAGMSTMGGRGGSTTGGLGGSYFGLITTGGNGATANNGSISIGGGGGGAGYDPTSNGSAGGRGGNTAGGIYNIGTLTLTGSLVTNNIAAGGGGGGGATTGGDGGAGVGGIWNAGGTLILDTTTNTSLSTGNVGAGGLGGKDVNGNPSASGTATSTVSTTGGGTTTIAPAAPGTPDMTAGTDTGKSGTDNITSNTTPTFTGTAQAGSTVTLYDTNGVTVLGSTTATGGIWTITSSTLSSGAHTITAKATVSGVTSVASAALAITIDTSAPAAPGIPDMTAGTDSGSSNSDNITSNTTPIFTGTAEANATVTLYDTDGTTVLGTTTADGSGSWSITSSALSEGTHTLTAKATDVAGNVSTASSGLSSTIDTTAPTTTISSIAFSADTGASSTDLITSAASQTISATLSAGLAAGEIVYGSLDNGASWTDITSKVTGTTLSWNGTTLSGSNTLKLKVTDNAGNDGPVTSQAYTLDTTAPTTTISSIALSADTGTSGTDFITKTAAQTISATLSAGLAAGEIVYGSLNNGATWTDITAKVSGTVLIWDGITLSGSNTLKLKVTDAAGNDGAVASQAYTLDQTAPTVASVGVPANATYKVGDVLAFTVNTAENVAVTTGGTLGLTVGATARSATFDAGASTATALVYKYTVQTGDVDADGITVGALAGTTITDTAGNALNTTLNSVASTTSVNIDGVAPVVTGNIAVPADGLRVLGQTLDFTLTFDDNVVVTGTDSTLGLTIGSTARQAAFLSSTANSITYRYTVQAGDNDADGIAMGAISINTSTIKDATGNSANLSLAGHLPSTAGILIDTSAPTVTSVSVPANASYKAGQNLDFTVNLSESVTVTGTSSSLALDVGGVVRTASYLSSTGSSITYRYTVQAGDNDSNGITVGALTLNGTTVRDVASNDLVTTLNSVGSTAAVLVDTTAPAAPGTPDLASASDSGNSNVDNLTKVTTPVITGTAEAGSTVTLYDTDGTTVLGTGVATGGNWSITSSALSAGAHTLTATAADAAGNLSTASAGLSITIDATAPAAPAITAVSTDSNTLGDGITNDSTLNVSGTAEANSTVTITRSGVGTLGTVTADGVGNWTYNYTGTTLADGSYTFTATATDAAGNTSTSSAGFAVTVDTTAPAAPGTPDLAAASDLGSFNTDNITSVTTPVITGTAEAGAMVRLYDTDGTTELGSAVASGGNWSITSSALSAGAHTLTTKATDIAGNTSAASSGLAITIDTTVPAAPGALSLLSASDTGVSNADRITSNTTPTIAGTAESGAKVTLYDTDGTTALGTATADGSGNWSVTSTALAQGSHTLTAKATDIAGNIGIASTGLPVTIDTAAPQVSTATVNGATLTLTFTEKAYASTADGMTVTVNGSARAINAVAGSGTTSLTLTLASAVESGQTVKFDYNPTAPSSDLLDAAGNELAAVVAKVVTNATAAPDPGPVVVPPTTTTVDGVQLQIATVTNADGSTSQVLTIPVISDGRTDSVGNNTVADIPLVTAGGTSVLTAQVPAGFGITVSGSPSLKSAGSSLADLLREIRAHTGSGSADQAALTDGGTGFLHDLPANTPLLVQSIVPTMPPNTAPAAPLAIAGTPAAPGTPTTALVIDASGLPSGTAIQLQHVEFAAIVGSVRVTGGDGSQHVWGDSASQYIMLGADDDVLHGGAGNDTVGSAGGNDQIFGDEGDDLVFGGEGNDSIDGGTGNDVVRLAGASRADYSLRVDNGKLVVTHRNGGVDGIDTLANIETLRFAGTVTDTTAQGTLGRLYDAIFDRAPDQAGLTYWLAQHQQGVSLHDIAASFLRSVEAQSLHGNLSDASYVDLLYSSVFGRTADAAGRIFWLDTLASGKADRAGVLLSFIEAAEKLPTAQGNTLDQSFNTTDVASLVRLYDTLFDRAPDQAGLNYWIAASEAGMALRDIAGTFLTAGEAPQRYGVLDNAAFIATLYQVGLGRTGSSGEVAAWAHLLDIGQITRGDAALGFANSAEKIGLVGVITTSIETIG